MAAVQSKLNFTWLCCCLSQPHFTHRTFVPQLFHLLLEEVVLLVVVVSHPREREGKGRDRNLSAAVCSVVECRRRAGCLLGETGMELGQEAVGWQRRRPPARLFGLGCGRCWRGASWCWWQDVDVWRRAPLPAAAWGTRWTAMAWGSTPYPKTSPEGLRGCE